MQFKKLVNIKAVVQKYWRKEYQIKWYKKYQRTRKKLKAAIQILGVLRKSLCLKNVFNE